jgi:hypothetical protein
MWIEHVNVTGDHERDFHRHSHLIRAEDRSIRAGSVRIFPACCRWSKQAHCHREVLVPEPSCGMKARTETRIYGAIVTGKDLSSQARKENGRCHDGDRGAKVNRMTL